MIYLDASALVTLIAGRQYELELRQFLAERPGLPMGTSTIGFVSATNGNTATVTGVWDGSIYVPYTRIESSGDYLVISANGSTLYAGLAQVIRPGTAG